MSDQYEGAVCYLDGWHYSVVSDGNGGEVPDAKLFLEDDGTYRLATDADPSWHDRKHRAFQIVVPEGGSPAVAVTTEEMAAIQEMLDQRRGG